MSVPQPERKRVLTGYRPGDMAGRAGELDAITGYAAGLCADRALILLACSTGIWPQARYRDGVQRVRSKDFLGPKRVAQAKANVIQ